MKTLWMIALSVPLLTNPSLGSRSGDTIRGGLIGAATGALLAGLHSDISSRTAVPVMAGFGALAGYARHEYRHRDYYGHQGVGYAPSFYTYYPYAVPYRVQHTRSPYPYRAAPSLGPVAINAIRQQARAAAGRQQRPTDRHPGVTLVPVTFQLDNGMLLTIHLARIGNQFVGPRGETYSELPSQDILRQTYRP